MAVAFDAVSSAVNPGSDTLSHTCTGTNRYLLVHISIRSSQTCTGVTYNSVAMTQILVDDTSAINAGQTDYIFGLANPASGANNIVATFSGAGTRIFDGASYTGVNQSTTPDASGSGTGTTTTATKTLVTIADNCWVIGFAHADGTDFTAGTNTTMRPVGGQGDRQFCDTNAAQTPAGSHTINATDVAMGHWIMQAVSLAPVAATASNIRRRMLLGIGQ